MEHPQHETPKARQAFTDYVNMGPNRSLKTLSERYQGNPEGSPTKSLRRLKNWSIAFHWQEKLQEHEKTVSDTALEATITARKKEYEHALQEFSHHYKSAGRESFASSAIAIQEIRVFLNKEDFKINNLSEAVQLSQLLRNLQPFADYWAKSLGVDRMLEKMSENDQN